VGSDSRSGSYGDSALESNGAGEASKKVVFLCSSNLLGESDFLSESGDENLVMDFSENEDEKSVP